MHFHHKWKLVKSSLVSSDRICAIQRRLFDSPGVKRYRIERRERTTLTELLGMLLLTATISLHIEFLVILFAYNMFAW